MKKLISIIVFLIITTIQAIQYNTPYTKEYSWEQRKKYSKNFLEIFFWEKEK